MARRHHYRRTQKEAPELNITTFLNLMVVLVPFLLITAVFSRITVMELSIPTGAGGTSSEQQLSIEVIVRQKGLEISNGRQVLARFPLLKPEQVVTAANADEGAGDVEKDISKRYDLKTLSKYLTEIKSKYPDKTDAIVLMEPDIEYRVLISVMDAVRSSFVRHQGAEGEADVLQQLVLFPDISIGDAP
ncbi:MAG: biopolymer transporter ExbD [Gammaproteobacteria bacterium]|jgi:biopolymer transport protein ExbD|nr:biopolymer transporter ExbD [Gammaproteobacteria bacterium]